MTAFKTQIAADAALIQERAASLLPKDAPLTEAMLYALEGGKALRGFLVMESCRLHDVPEEAALDAALAIECMHAYSLVHDDLPAMDDDDLRRGRPTIHIKWDEAMAVLVGDALQTMSFSLLTNGSIASLPARGTNHAAEASLRLVHGLARAGGHRGMVLGQMLDIAAETADAPLTLEDIETLQHHKTGALIRWSATAGPVLVDADPAALTAYGQALGLAFQIVDDILDVEGDPDAVGKATGKDAAAGKATFVSLLGLDEAKSRANALVKEACDSIHVYGDRALVLQDAARFVFERQT